MTRHYGNLCGYSLCLKIQAYKIDVKRLVNNSSEVVIPRAVLEKSMEISLLLLYVFLSHP